MTIAVFAFSEQLDAGQGGPGRVNSKLQSADRASHSSGEGRGHVRGFLDGARWLARCTSSAASNTTLEGNTIMSANPSIDSSELPSIDPIDLDAATGGVDWGSWVGKNAAQSAISGAAGAPISGAAGAPGSGAAGAPAAFGGIPMTAPVNNAVVGAMFHDSRPGPIASALLGGWKTR